MGISGTHRFPGQFRNGICRFKFRSCCSKYSKPKGKKISVCC
jgi:hypothetical protein